MLLCGCVRGALCFVSFRFVVVALPADQLHPCSFIPFVSATTTLFTALLFLCSFVFFIAVCFWRLPLRCGPLQRPNFSLQTKHRQTDTQTPSQLRSTSMTGLKSESQKRIIAKGRGGRGRQCKRAGTNKKTREKQDNNRAMLYHCNARTGAKAHQVQHLTCPRSRNPSHTHAHTHTRTHAHHFFSVGGVDKRREEDAGAVCSEWGQNDAITLGRWGRSRTPLGMCSPSAG